MGGFWKIFPTEHWCIFESWSLAKGILTQKIKKGSPQNHENTSKWALWSKWNSRSPSQNWESCSFWTKKVKTHVLNNKSSICWRPSTGISKNISVGNLVLRRVSGSKIIKTLKIPLSCVRFLGVFSLFSKKLFRKQTFFLQMSCPLLGVNFQNAEKGAPQNLQNLKFFRFPQLKCFNETVIFYTFGYLFTISRSYWKS